MSATTCPYCKALTNFTPVWTHPIAPPGSGFSQDGAVGVAAQRCTNELCQMIITTITDRQSSIIRMWPEVVGGKHFPDVPTHIAEAADEAYRCYSIKVYRGAVLLARSVIEATAKEKGIIKGNLVAKIDQMHKDGLIREYVKEGAHEVRYLGNDMAHGDFTDPVAPEEAALVLTLMDEVLAEVFQSPERVAKARGARLAKVQQSSP